MSVIFLVRSFYCRCFSLKDGFRGSRDIEYIGREGLLNFGLEAVGF